MLHAAKQFVHTAAAGAVKVGSERRYLLLGAAVCTCACVYFVKRARRNLRKGEDAAPRVAANPSEKVILQEVVLEKVAEEVVDSVATTLAAVVPAAAEQEPVLSPEALAAKEKSKRKKEKLKKAMVDGVGLVLGDSAGKFVESVMDLSQQAKGLESLKSGKLSKLFSKDIIPVLKNKLQKKKFPAIVGTTESPLGELHYEVSGITLESLDIDPSIQCDITDKNEALQIKLLISSAKLRNISWKCGTAKIKEKGTANAEIVKAVCLFRITVDRSEKLPRLSIKHCSIDLEQFNLELHGGKASWVYNKLTSVFSNKIKTKIKEKIDKMLTKRCRQFETKINLAASHLLSLFTSRKKRDRIEAQQATPHKKCFLYPNENAPNELDCILMDLRQFTTIADLQIAFFGELGVDPVTAQTTRVRFRDRAGTLVSVSRSTTIAQIIEHAESMCFYRESSSLLLSPSNSSPNFSNSPGHFTNSSNNSLTASHNSLNSSRGSLDPHPLNSSYNPNTSQRNVSSDNFNINNSWNDSSPLSSSPESSFDLPLSPGSVRLRNRSSSESYLR